MVNGIGGYGIPAQDYYVRVLTLVGISIIAAVSLNLINGYTGQFSIGHAGFMAVGGYTAAYISFYYGAGILNTLQGLPLPVALTIRLFISLLIGVVFSALAGFVVGMPSLRLKGDYLAIVTLGFGEIIRIIILSIDSVGGARGFSSIVQGATEPPDQRMFEFLKESIFFWVFLFAVITVVIVKNLVNSTFGRALTSIRENEIAAEAMGINTTRYKVIAFVISAGLAGLAGGLFAHYDNYLNTNSFTFVKSVEVIIMIVLGGMGSITGAILGATVLTILPELLRDLQQYRMVIYSLLLIVIMIVRPQGILGRRELSLSGLFGKKKTV
ncbi:MAG: branched-chain amino acid ABC transporter permease [Blastocatellia bacterium]|nr:branched-chain amino acid ABC transporter permease [Blastocatellia bacterium]